jgi:hypothetical protein
MSVKCPMCAKFSALHCTISSFENFETGPAQICADLLEMHVNQKYCQSRHLISQNCLSLRKYRTHIYRCVPE